MRNFLLLISVTGLFSCGPTKTSRSHALMDKEIEDSLEIVVRIGDCIFLKGKNQLIFHLKNNGHSAMTLYSGRIAPGQILDSGGHNVWPINRIDYHATQNDTVILGAGGEQEISYQTGYFSNYDLKTGQPYYFNVYYISSMNTTGGSKQPPTKFYLCKP